MWFTISQGITMLVYAYSTEETFIQDILVIQKLENLNRY